jgi:hypothetical protein
MPFVDWTSSRPGRVLYTYAGFAASKLWFFEQWSDLAEASHRQAPGDLSGSCKYGSIFMQSVFGGAIRGHYAHQYNFIDGHLVDLSHDALDVGRMNNPYLHEPEYFAIPEMQVSLAACLPRAQRWADQFVASRPETP